MPICKHGTTQPYDSLLSTQYGSSRNVHGFDKNVNMGDSTFGHFKTIANVD